MRVTTHPSPWDPSGGKFFFKICTSSQLLFLAGILPLSEKMCLNTPPPFSTYSIRNEVWISLKKPSNEITKILGVEA